MAFAGTIAPRRKTMTYGKHPRRLVSTLSSATEIEFAQDAGASISDPKGINEQWQSHDRHASSKLLHGHHGAEVRTESLAGHASSTRPKPRVESCSSPCQSLSAQDEPLYDLPLPNDGFGYNANAARKRRKLMPSKTVADNQSLVFDDESLQRHVAAEARREQHILHSSRFSPAEQDCDSSSWVMQNQIAARGRSNEDVSEISEDTTLDPTHDIFDAKAVEQIKGLSVSPKQSKEHLKAKFTSHRVQTIKMDPAKATARPTKPDTVFNREYPQVAKIDTRNAYTLKKPVYQPTTPPRSTGAPGRGTTPRQRELWNKLLIGNAQITSPSSLELPGFKSRDNGHEDSHSHGHTKSRKALWGPCQPSMLKAQPKKIVDTLHQSDHYRDYSSDDCDDMRGINSSDDKSEYMPSEVSTAREAIIVQTSPIADRRGLVTQSQDHSSNASQTISGIYRGGHKVTYARQRSYLTDNDFEEAAMIDFPVPSEPKNKRGSRRRKFEDQLTQIQSKKSLNEELGALADSQGGTMRSIHELREAGGNVRLVSELEAILDDIGDGQPGSTSLRRIRLIDLVAKLQEPANCRLFVDQGLENPLMADVGFDGDLITNGLLIAALLQLMTFSSSALLLTHIGKSRALEVLVDLLGSDQDLLSYAKLRENQMSKAGLADLNQLSSALLNSTAWRAGRPSELSCHVLSLGCLEQFVRQTREGGSLSEVISTHAIRRIVTTSVPPFPTLPPQPGESSIVCLELAISILESCTLSNAAECQTSLWAGETLERVIGLLPLLDLWKGDEPGTSRTLTLRLYLNLTNNNPSLCEDFSTPEIISVMFKIVISHFEQVADSALEIDKTLLLDDLILSLGFLINLADLSKTARQLMLDLRHRNQSYLDTLLELFMKKSRNAAEVSSLEETTSNVAFGWMSVLLGWLCLNPAIKARVSDHLPGNNLKQLLGAVEEFLRYHRRVDQVVLRVDGEDDARASFVGRLQSHVDDLRKADGFSESFDVVAGVGNS